MVVEQGLKPRMYFIRFRVIGEVDVTAMFASSLIPTAALERD
jgi:hypothetical protein